VTLENLNDATNLLLADDEYVDMNLADEIMRLSECEKLNNTNEIIVLNNLQNDITVYSVEIQEVIEEVLKIKYNNNFLLKLK
jgi:hypothetical protein